MNWFLLKQLASRPGRISDPGLVLTRVEEKYGTGRKKEEEKSKKDNENE